MFIFNHLISYLSIGLFTTIFSYIVMFLLIYLGFNPYVSNFIGYLLGLILTFVGNKNITFKNKSNNKSQVIKFLISFFISYLTNYFFLYLFLNIMKYDVYLSQVFAGFFYVIIMFCLMRQYVFKNIS